MCADGDRVPGSAAEALRMARAGLDCLNGPAGADLPAAALGGVLTSLGEIQSKFAAAQAGLLARFGAADAHDSDGYATSRSWLAAMTRLTFKDAGAAVRQMRLLGRHPDLAGAMGAGQVSPSWAREIAGGATLEDLRMLFGCVYEQWRARQPDPEGDDDGFDDRYAQVAATFGGAGVIRGNLTPGCTAAVRAVLESLGRKRGPEDARTEGQRFHDALQEGCELLLRARLVPDRAGADTQVIAHIALSQLRAMDGGVLEAAWIAARLGEPGFLAGTDAAAAACDALVVPVVTGHPDMTVIDQIIELALAAAGQEQTGARAALRHAIARLAVDFVSGPAGLASLLRTSLLAAPFSTASLPLDIGYSDSIPGHIRRAVLLRDRHCAWPGCRKPPAACDVHHITHKKHGGKTSVRDCILLCQFHHDICIHREGWQIILHPDGTTEARGPDGQVLMSHAPPTLRAG